MNLLKTGNFTATITIGKTNYLDVTLTATFEKKEQIFIFDEKTKTITGVTTYGETYFATATEVTFPDQIDGTDVEEINEGNYYNVFGNNYRNPNRTIKTIRLPKNLKTIGYSAFYYCTSLTSITMGNSVTTIGNSAFSNCDILTSITMGNSVTTIGEDAFSNCRSLTSITLPNSVTSIGKYAFHKCTSLTSINIPNSVTSIGQRAFADCYKVIVTIRQTNPAKITLVHTEAFDSGVLKIRVPSGSLQTYKTRYPWREWADKMIGY